MIAFGWFGLFGLLVVASIAEASELTGFLQSSYAASRQAASPNRGQEREQIRLYLRDRLMVKSDWTLEYGLDRAREFPGSDPVLRPRYATTLRGSAYLATASFVPTRNPNGAGGIHSDEWRGSLSVAGERWPQLSMSYLNRKDRLGGQANLESWLGSASWERRGLTMHGSMQGQRQYTPMPRTIDAHSLSGRGDLGYLHDFGSVLHGTASYGLAFGRQRSNVVSASTNTDHVAGMSIGWVPRGWANWTTNANGHWGLSGRTGARTRTREQLLSTTLALTPVNPFEFTLGYMTNRSVATVGSKQESLTGSAFARFPAGEQNYVTTQVNGGRQLSSSIGPFNFAGGVLESGGAMYRGTRYRVTATVQRNGGQSLVVPLQASRVATLESDPYRTVHATVSYTSTYGGSSGRWLRSTAEVSTFGLTLQPRGLGSVSLNYTKSWTTGIGREGYLTAYASTRTATGIGLSAAYTRHDRALRGLGSQGSTDSLQERLDFELRDQLTMAFSRDETGVGKAGSRVDWQGDVRWSF